MNVNKLLLIYWITMSPPVSKQVTGFVTGKMKFYRSKYFDERSIHADIGRDMKLAGGHVKAFSKLRDNEVNYANDFNAVSDVDATKLDNTDAKDVDDMSDNDISDVDATKVGKNKVNYANDFNAVSNVRATQLGENHANYANDVNDMTDNDISDVDNIKVGNNKVNYVKDIRAVSDVDDTNLGDNDATYAKDVSDISDVDATKMRNNFRDKMDNAVSDAIANNVLAISELAGTKDNLAVSNDNTLNTGNAIHDLMNNNNVLKQSDAINDVQTDNDIHPENSFIQTSVIQSTIDDVRSISNAVNVKNTPSHEKAVQNSNGAVNNWKDNMVGTGQCETVVEDKPNLTTIKCINEKNSKESDKGSNNVNTEPIKNCKVEREEYKMLMETNVNDNSLKNARYNISNVKPTTNKSEDQNIDCTPTQYSESNTEVTDITTVGNSRQTEHGKETPTQHTDCYRQEIVLRKREVMAGAKANMEPESNMVEHRRHSQTPLDREHPKRLVNPARTEEQFQKKTPLIMRQEMKNLNGLHPKPQYQQKFPVQAASATDSAEAPTSVDTEGQPSSQYFQQGPFLSSQGFASDGTQPLELKENPMITRLFEKQRQIENLKQLLMQVESKFQMEVNEVGRLQQSVADAEKELDDAVSLMQDVKTSNIKGLQHIEAAQDAAGRNLESKALKAHAEESQLAMHDQVLFSERQRLNALRAQMIYLQTELAAVQNSGILTFEDSDKTGYQPYGYHYKSPSTLSGSLKFYPPQTGPFEAAPGETAPRRGQLFMVAETERREER